MTDEPDPQPRVLGLFGLAMINIVAIASLRDLPQMASYGIGSIFFYLLAAVVFFIPVSLVAAELEWLRHLETRSTEFPVSRSMCA